MTDERMIWTPERVLAFQAAFRDHDPLMTDERFAQDILRIAPRSLYLWKRRPDMRLRPGTQQALNDALQAAPEPVVARLRELTSSADAEPPARHAVVGYRLQLADTLSALDDAATDGPELAYEPSSLAAAVLDWISTPRLADPRNLSVGAQDVEHIRATTQALDALERTMGGPGCRQTATSFLHDVAMPMLAAHQEAGVHAELFSAVAELCEVVGWMAYDAGEHGTAQAYFTHALRLTREAGDDALAAYLMTSLTHQAMFLGHPRDALRIARTATEVANSAQELQVVAEGELLSARALAHLGDAHEGAAALTRAENAFERRSQKPLRTWAAHWDDVIFSSHAGTTWLQLGDTSKARRLMRRVWDASSRHPRRRIYAGAELGIAAARSGDIDEATSMAQQILPLVSQLDSRRAQHHLRRLADELKEHSSATLVKDVLNEIANLRTKGSQAL
ncbi:hypothetical protein [Jiangella gansuensis]|uniref:hypothetical protein n=1 Tax=Jiangella gansuensis TaxID=281473 RepID=UPI0012FA0490|nr:hypothetical protein [Jiangella gansuensis]